MRRIVSTFIAIASIALLASSLPASAGGKKHDWVCWMQTNGHTECAWLPEPPPYRVSGVKKPHKHKGHGMPCRHCFVDFTLDDPKIRDLERHSSATGMRRFHDATLYGEKYRGYRD